MKAAIEKFPHVVNKVTLLWNSKELDSVLEKMLTEDTRFDRQGWPEEAFEELFFLRTLNYYVDKYKPVDPWTDNLGRNLN
jgi:hypothetical protein